MKRRTALCGLAGAALPLFHVQRVAASEPELLKCLVGFSAGSVPDVLARIVGRPLSETMKRPLVVDNRAGVGGQLALAALKQAPADGSTIAITPLSALSLYPSTYAKLPYDPTADFRPVCSICVTDFAFVVEAGHPARSIQEFVAWAKANPGKGSVGNPGNGSSPHFAAWSFNTSAGLDLAHVAYRMPPQIAQDIVAGSLTSGMASSSLFAELVKGGRLRVLATTGSRRSSLYPYVPTFSEAGYATVVGEEWFALFVRQGTPVATVKSLASAAYSLADLKEVQSAMSGVGVTLEIHDAVWVEELVRTEGARWRDIAQRASFKAQ